MAATHRATVQVMQFLDGSPTFAPDGPAGRLVFKRDARTVRLARRRLDMLLARSRLGWVQSSVMQGDPGGLLACVLMNWQPDLVIVSTELGQKQWVEFAAMTAGISMPDIFGAETGASLTPKLDRPITRPAPEFPFARWLLPLFNREVYR